MNVKSVLIENIEKSREEFLDFLDSLDGEDFNKPVSTSTTAPSTTWTVKDILVHLSRWEAELVKFLWQIKQGQKPLSAPFFLNEVEVDQLNNTWYREGRDRTLENALEDFHAVRNQTLLRLEPFTEQDLDSKSNYTWLKGRSLSEILASNTYEHEAEHLEQMKKWKAATHETGSPA